MLWNNWKKTYKEKLLIFQYNSSFMYQEINFKKCKACSKAGSWMFIHLLWNEVSWMAGDKVPSECRLPTPQSSSNKCHVHGHNKRDTIFLQFLANVKLTHCSRWFFKPSMHYSPLRGLQCLLFMSNHHTVAFASSLECFQTNKFKINSLKFNK